MSRRPTKIDRTRIAAGPGEHAARVGPGHQPRSGSSPQYLAEVNGIIYFAATQAGSGTELWASDGTFSGTRLVKDIRPGLTPRCRNTLRTSTARCTSRPTTAPPVRGFWKSNGTSAGTVLVEDINPAHGDRPAELIAVAGTAFFVADNPDRAGTHGHRRRPPPELLLGYSAREAASEVGIANSPATEFLFSNANDATHGRNSGNPTALQPVPSSSRTSDPARRTAPSFAN